MDLTYQVIGEQMGNQADFGWEKYFEVQGLGTILGGMEILKGYLGVGAILRWGGQFRLWTFKVYGVCFWSFWRFLQFLFTCKYHVICL